LLFLAAISATNRLCHPAKVQIDFVPPFDLLPKYKGFQKKEKKAPAPQGRRGSVKNAECPVWWYLLCEVREFFEQSGNL